LVLIARNDSRIALTIARGFDLRRALGGRRLALADPDSVPAGKYARAALAALGVWPRVADRVAPAENVRAALAYVARGEAPLGIVYATDAMVEPRVRTVGIFPANLHPRIVYPAALVRGGRPGSAAFLRYLAGREAADVFRRAGFVILRRNR
jgi:molybdate transport system substrate-binding protein